MVEEISSVEDFKERVKALLKESKFKDAITFANIKFEASCFEELPIRQEVTLVHWWTKAYVEGGDLRNTTTKCLTRIHTVINKLSSPSASSDQTEKDQCIAELLYLKRAIETQAMFASGEDALIKLQQLVAERPENKTDLLINKYLVKSLLKNDEYQIAVDTKVGYKQLIQAQRIDNDVLVRTHGHKKETIKVQINKMQKFKNFMDVKSFNQLSAMAMQTHMKKPEVVQIMRALAVKYSDLGDHSKAMEYVGRLETLA